MKSESNGHIIVERWRADAAKPNRDLSLRLRTAAMAGHMASDLSAARRGALIDILADGRPHPREELIKSIQLDLAADCWGARPEEALVRDVAALRRGGVRVAYSRRPGLEGYYLEYPALAGEQPRAFDQANDAMWRESIAGMTVAQKNETAFGAAEYALQQKRALTRIEHPEWSEAQIDETARGLVFGGELDGR